MIKQNNSRNISDFFLGIFYFILLLFFGLSFGFAGPWLSDTLFSIAVYFADGPTIINDLSLLVLPLFSIVFFYIIRKKFVALGIFLPLFIFALWITSNIFSHLNENPPSSMSLVWVPQASVTYSYAQAVSYCQNLGDGWRLPTIDELVPAMEYELSHNFLHRSGFHTHSYYWSGSEADTSQVWVAIKGAGLESRDLQDKVNSHNNYVRCVR